MKRVIAVAKVTTKEGLRNKAVYGIFTLALVVMGINIMLAGFFMHDIGKVAVNMNLSALSFCGLLLVFFVSINLLAKDIDRKTIHIVLSLPITRFYYLLGKFLGLCVVLLVSEVVLFSMSTLTVALLKLMYPVYFNEFVWVAFFQAAFFVLVKLWLLSAFVVFFSTLTSSSFITLVFSVATYVVGESLEEVLLYLKAGAGFDFMPMPEFFLFVLDLLSYVLPNLSMFDIGGPASHGIVMAGTSFWLPIGYALVYSGVLLAGSSICFNYKEFN